MYDSITDEVIKANTFAPGRQLDPMSEVIVSVGAYGSLYASFSAFVNPGDEVIIMDPSFDCYDPMTRLNDGVPVHISLKPVCYQILFLFY